MSLDNDKDDGFMSDVMQKKKKCVWPTEVLE